MCSHIQVHYVMCCLTHWPCMCTAPWLVTRATQAVDTVRSSVHCWIVNALQCKLCPLSENLFPSTPDDAVVEEGEGFHCACWLCLRLPWCSLFFCLFFLARTPLLDAVTVVLFNLLSVFADKQTLGVEVTGTDVRASAYRPIGKDTHTHVHTQWHIVL